MNYPEIRQHFHSLAEASGHEDKTLEAILHLLRDFTPTQIHTFPDSHNIIAIYDSGVEGPTLLLRGDMDAVGVDEHLSLPYASRTPGYAHKCGHDGHTTILLGVAEQLHLHHYYIIRRGGTTASSPDTKRQNTTVFPSGGRNWPGLQTINSEWLPEILQYKYGICPA